MNRVWQEQLDKAGANPRDDYLISSSGLAAQLGEAGVKVLDATTHLRPTEDGGFSSEPGFDDFLSEHIPGAQFADYVMEWLESPELDQAYRRFINGSEPVAVAS